MGFILKIAVIVIVAFVAWSGWRWLQRVQGGPLDRPRARPPAPPRAEEPPALKPVDDMHRCTVCGDYIAINARRCDRPICPRG